MYCSWILERGGKLHFHDVSYRLKNLVHFITFRTYTMHEKHYNHEKIRLWHIYAIRGLLNTFMLFLRCKYAFNICMCLCICVCVGVCMLFWYFDNILKVARRRFPKYVEKSVQTLFFKEEKENYSKKELFFYIYFKCSNIFYIIYESIKVNKKSIQTIFGIHKYTKI